LQLALNLYLHFLNAISNFTHFSVAFHIIKAILAVAAGLSAAMYSTA